MYMHILATETTKLQLHTVDDIIETLHHLIYT